MHLDARIFCFGDFCGDDRQTEPIALPLAYACRVIRLLTRKTFILVCNYSYILFKFALLLYRSLFVMASTVAKAVIGSKIKSITEDVEGKYMYITVSPCPISAFHVGEGMIN